MIILILLSIGLPFLVGLITFIRFTISSSIKTNSWHTKLINKIWGLDHLDFNYMCPYAWVVFGTITFIWAIVLFKVLSNIYNFFMVFIRKIRNKIDEWNEAYWRDYIATLRDPANKKYNKHLRRYRKMDHQDRLHLVGIYLSDEEYAQLEEDRIKWKEDHNASKKVNNLTKIAKRSLYLLVGVLTIAALFGLYKLILLAVTWDWYNILMGCLAIVGLIVAAFTLIGVIYVIVYLVKLIAKRISMIEGADNIGVSISGGVKSFFNWIEGGFVTLWKFLVALKDAHCPAIQWEDGKES